MYESKQTSLTLEDVSKYKDIPQRFIEYLKKNRYDFDEEGEDGKTILSILIDQGCSIDLVWFCLEYGADPNIQDKEGNTALHHAFNKGSKNYILALLLFNADIEIRNFEPAEIEGDPPGKTCYEKYNSVLKEEELNKLKEIFDMELKKVFIQLTENRRNKLKEIYNFLDEGEMKTGIAEEKFCNFTFWLNDGMSQEEAREDGKTFFSLSRIIGGTNVQEIYLEEWMLSMTRIAKWEGLKAIDNFIQTFEKVRSSGKKFEEY